MVLKKRKKRNELQEFKYILRRYPVRGQNVLTGPHLSALPACCVGPASVQDAAGDRRNAAPHTPQSLRLCKLCNDTVAAFAVASRAHPNAHFRQEENQ